MSKELTESEANVVMQKIQNAKSKTELEGIKRFLQEYNEDDPNAKKLVLTLRRK